MIAITWAKRQNWAAIGWRRVIIRLALQGLAGRAWRWRIGSPKARHPLICGKWTFAVRSPFKSNRKYLKERVSETLGLLYSGSFPLSPDGNQPRRAPQPYCTTI
jgi:hypothetical protein